MSFSEVSTVLACSAKWRYRYHENLPSSTTGAQALGTAVHSALAAEMRARTAGRRLAEAEAVGRFRSSLTDALRDARLDPDETPLLLGATGETLVSEYLAGDGLDLDPIRVEELLEGSIAGIRMVGYPDLIHRREGRPVVADWKVTAREPAGMTDDQRLQLAIYALLYNGGRHEPMRVENHYLVRSKLRTVVHAAELDAEDYRYVENVLPAAARIIMDWNHYPNRSHVLCSKRYCPFWKTCVEDYGGTVKD